MDERPAFIPFAPLPGARLFVHLHMPEPAPEFGYIFLNPIFDEKKKVQVFQSALARALSGLGAAVARFDYFGTGDSDGESHEMTVPGFAESLRSARAYAMRNGFPAKLALCGIRAGAALAAHWAKGGMESAHRILIQPVFSGSEYIREQRLRRSIFWRVNGMKNQEAGVQIGGRPMEDFQGHLLSHEFISDLSGLRLEGGDLESPRVSVVAAKGSLPGWARKTTRPPIEVDVPEFWDHPEPFDMDGMIREVVGIHRRLTAA